MLHLQKAVGNFLQVDTSSQVCENKGFFGQLVPLTLRIVENARCRSSRISQIASYVWEKERWANQKSSSPKDGMIISSNTGNLQGELMEKGFSSYCRCFVAKRTISCARSMSRFEEAKEKIDTLLLQKPFSIEFYL